jgi:hypothetical protein
MNRQQRRADAVRAHGGRPDTCPCCDARMSFQHAIQHGAPTIHGPSCPAEDGTLAVEFGIIRVQECPDGSFEVSAFGELVMTFDSETYSIIEPGPWLATLSAVRAQLDAKFGPVSPDGATRH